MYRSLSFYVGAFSRLVVDLILRNSPTRQARCVGLGMSARIALYAHTAHVAYAWSAFAAVVVRAVGVGVVPPVATRDKVATPG